MKNYPRHNVRKVHKLDGLWDFAFLGEDVDLSENSLEEILLSWQPEGSMPVPGCPDASPRFAGVRGTFIMSTQVSITPGTAGRLHFQGLGLWCRVYVDGFSVGEVSLPYSGFSLEVPSSGEILRTVTVVIDNRFDADRIPLQHQYFDFYAYAGIYRSVFWHEYSGWCLDRAVVKPFQIDDDELTVDIFLHGEVPEKVNLSVSVDDDEESFLPQVKVTLGEMGGVVRVNLSGDGLSRWSPEAPCLHTIAVRTDEDDLIERFGLRTLSRGKGKIYLDGEAVKLKGYNRHEVHPQFGPALPLQQLWQDIQILKDLGCNYVRGSHYSQDPRFLDLCDEAGLLVMEESLAWQPQKEHFEDKKFCRLQETQTRLMVRNSINHPSVIMWGFCNEGRSDLPESVTLYETLARAIREEDSSRFVTFATCRPFEELNYELCDIISVNMYPGWYEDYEEAKPLECIAPKIDRVLKHLKEQGQADKPFIISEIGAGALYGWHDPLISHWSEEFQSAYLKRVLEEVVGNDGIAGVSLWQFCDGRTYSSPRSLSRPRGFNNKGTLDEYRRPKQAYDVVKEIFLGADDLRED